VSLEQYVRLRDLQVSRRSHRHFKIKTLNLIARNALKMWVAMPVRILRTCMAKRIKLCTVFADERMSDSIIFQFIQQTIYGRFVYAWIESLKKHLRRQGIIRNTKSL
jgi:hypothetical protein